MTWVSEETTVKRVEEMLREAFHNAGRNIKLVAIWQSLLEMVCTAPTQTIGCLVLVARTSISILRELGVVKLTIGDEVILDDLAVRKNSMLNLIPSLERALLWCIGQSQRIVTNVCVWGEVP